jgi:hypothetical protein
MNLTRILPASFVLSMRAALTNSSVAVATDYAWAGAQGGKWCLSINERASEAAPVRHFTDLLHFVVDAIAGSQIVRKPQSTNDQWETVIRNLVASQRWLIDNNAFFFRLLDRVFPVRPTGMGVQVACATERENNKGD